MVDWAGLGASELTSPRLPSTPMVSPRATGMDTGRMPLLASFTTRNSEVKLLVDAGRRAAQP